MKIKISNQDYLRVAENLSDTEQNRWLSWMGNKLTQKLANENNSD